MAQTLANLVVDLEANSAKLTSGLKKAEGAVKSSSARMNRSLSLVDKGFNRMSGAVAASTKRFLALNLSIGALAGTAGLGLLLRNSIRTADGIAKTADKVGITTDALQELRAAAELSGVAQNVLDLSLQRFSRRVGEAAQGAGELKDTLKQYGIETRDSTGRQRDLTDVLGDYAEAVKNAESNQEQLRLAFKGFDSEGAALVNLLRKGRDGMEEMRSEARRLGFVIEESLIRRAEKANDQLSIIGGVLSTQVTRAVLTLAPTIIRLGAAFGEAAPKLKEFIDSLLPSSLASSEELRKRILALRVEMESLNAASGADLERRDRLRPAASLRESQIPSEIAALEELEAAARKAEETSSALLDTLNGKDTPPVGKEGPLQVQQIKDFNREMERLRDRAKSVVEQTRTPFESFQARIAELNLLVEKGGLGWDAYTRAVAEAQDTLEQANERTREAAARARQLAFEQTEAGRRAQDMADAGKAAASELTAGLERATLKGERFIDTLQSIADALLQIAFRVAVLAPFERALQGVFSGGTAAAPSAGGGTGAGGGLTDGGFTSLAATQSSLASSSAMSVVINNNTSEPIQASNVSRNSQGDLEVTLDRAMARAATSGGAFSKALAEAGRITQR